MTIPSGGLALEAEVHPPKGPRRPMVVLAHPHPRMGGDMHNKVIDQLFRRGSEKGWGVVRFNFRGVGASGGTYDHGVGETEDLLAVVGFASGEFNVELSRITLVGYSFGSWIAAKSAAQLSRLRRLVLIAPPVATMDFSIVEQTAHPKHVFAAGRDEFVARPDLDAWYARLRPPKSLRVFEGADHFFTGSTVELLRAVIQTIDE